MARYQLRRPSPVKIYSRFRRRQDGTATTMPIPGEEKEEEEEEEDEGPESPDSPFSSPSTVGELSEGDDSDSDDDEPPSPAESGSISQPIQTLGPDSTSASSLPTTTTASTSTSESSTSLTSLPSFQFTSSPAVVAIPLTTGTTLITTSLPSTTSTPGGRNQSDRQKQTSPTASVSLPPPPPPPPLSTAAAELSAGETAASEMAPKPEPPIMTKSAMVAAIVLGILGALALLIAAVIFMRRRKAKSYMDHMPLPDEKYDSSAALRAPETAHTGTASSIFARLQGANNGGAEGHLTRSTDRSNTLFGPGPYSRPETVSTTRNNSRIPPPTPNPFEDPQRNKAYDMLNNRPRSTTLTDRGSWRENPFKNPESDRFDPFGELKAKARQERLRYLQQVKREAELQKQMEQKEAMGLRPDDMPWGHDNGYR